MSKDLRNVKYVLLDLDEILGSEFPQRPLIMALRFALGADEEDIENILKDVALLDRLYAGEISFQGYLYEIDAIFERRYGKRLFDGRANDENLRLFLGDIRIRRNIRDLVGCLRDKGYKLGIFGYCFFELNHFLTDQVKIWDVFDFTLPLTSFRFRLNQSSENFLGSVADFLPYDPDEFLFLVSNTVNPHMKAAEGFLISRISFGEGGVSSDNGYPEMLMNQ